MSELPNPQPSKQSKQRDHLNRMIAGATAEGDFTAAEEYNEALALLSEEPETTTVETILERAEVIGRDEQGNNQWRLYTADGLYITQPNSYEAKKLTPRSSGKVLLDIEGGRVVGITWVVERSVKAQR